MIKNESGYLEIAKARTQEKRNIVISAFSEGGFTMAQQLEVTEGNHTICVFLKGAFHVDDIHGLYNLRDALNVAIMKIENKDSIHNKNNDWEEK